MESRKEDARALRRATRAIHSGGLDAPIFGEVSPPIFQTSTFSFPNVEEGAARFSGRQPGYIYSRIDNPTVKALEENIAVMEGAWGAMATGSGMAAITTMFLALLDRDAHVVAADALYGPSRVVLETQFSRFGVTSSFVSVDDIEDIGCAMRPETKVVYIETPTNPTLEIIDIARVAEIAHAHGALLAVDNTFASPYLQRPIEFGADIVVHSLTKYINGHSDVVGGAIATASEELHKRLRKTLNLFGGVMDPHQAWLVLRGARTLPLRVERSQENAMKIAEFLETHPKIAWVRYPGLSSHPGRELAKRQMDGFGAMICFGVRGGLEGGITLMNNVRLITLAVSLGGVESLIEHPASMTHASLPREEREKSGITDEMVRLSVGCEAFEDLRDDLDQALGCID
ncbi:MAG: PLP-dependent aspartate aminotransferase family protein [Syntrophobacteraceae bacterium]